MLFRRSPTRIRGQGQKRDSVWEEARPKGPSQELAHAFLVTECVDRIFYKAKLRLQCPPRWRTLFLAAAKRLERRLDVARREMFTAAAVDDLEALRHLRNEIPKTLWAFWSFDLGLVARATSRCQPQQLALLPELQGPGYLSAQQAALARRAIEDRPFAASPEGILDRQRGLALTGVVRKAMDTGGEIDLDALQELLTHPASGNWQRSLRAAVGVNCGALAGDFAGWRPLHFVAAATGARKTAADAARRLLDARADALLMDASGATALMVAAANNHLAVVEVLLDRGAPLEAPDFAGCTALMTAARGRHAEVVRSIVRWAVPSDAWEALFESEAELLAQRYSLLKGVQLHARVAAGDLHRVKELLLVGDGRGGDLANVNFADSLGRSPLHIAVTHMSGDLRTAEMVRALVAYRASVDAQDVDGETPLHVAARIGRAPIVRQLLRLKAHPGLADRRGRTPLMLAAATPGAPRQLPTYDGVLVSRAHDWIVVEEILMWQGWGEPPGPKIRRVKPKEKTLREQAEERQKAFEKGASAIALEHRELHLTPSDMAKARGEAIASLGFDDQWIIDRDGRVNRGDRLQLPHALFWTGPDGRPAAYDYRMRLLWDNLTGQLVRMEVRGTLPPRLGELLHYLLLSMLGEKGACFGPLVASCIGKLDTVLPSWEAFCEALSSHGDLDDRVAAVRRLGFRGPKPERALWVGSCWERGDYPREPLSAPWGAFAYVERDKAVRLHEGANQVVREFSVVIVTTNFMSDNDIPVALEVGQRGRVREIDNEGDALIKFDDHEVTQLVFQDRFGNMVVEAVFEDEAFKGNKMSPFDIVKDDRLKACTGSRPLPCRTEQLQLANRLFVDEALGLRAVAEERVKVIGQRLLCPLLEEAAVHLTTMGTVAEKVASHREMLRYVAAQMEEPDGDLGELPTVERWETAERKLENRRAPFAASWGRARGAVLRALLAPPRGLDALAALTPGPDVELAAGGDMVPAARVPPEQSSVMLPEMVLWLRSRHSTCAYIELRACGAVVNADDFSNMVAGVAARAPKDFAEAFWRATFYLLLWGRAKHLQPFFSKELRRRLPEGASLRGPFVRPRMDFLLEMERKSKEDATQRRKDDARWLAWEAAERMRKRAVGLMATEASSYRAAAKIVEPRFKRHMRTWGGVAFIGGPSKPTAEDVASGGGVPAARMLHAPQAVDRSLAESRAATAADGLPSGITDMLRAEVVCDTEEALRAAFAALCAPSPEPRGPQHRNVAALEEETPEIAAADPRGHIVKLTVVRILNDFHKEQREAVFPAASRILLVARMSVLARGIGQKPVDQLVHVELLLPFTAEARWLADFMRMDPLSAETLDYQAAESAI